MGNHIQISRYLSVEGVTTYYVISKKKNSSSILWYGTNKQAAYQVAYRESKKENTPAYAVQYNIETDEHGAKFIIPVGNERLTN